MAALLAWTGGTLSRALGFGAQPRFDSSVKGPLDWLDKPLFREISQGQSAFSNHVAHKARSPRQTTRHGFAPASMLENLQSFRLPLMDYVVFLGVSDVGWRLASVDANGPFVSTFLEPCIRRFLCRRILIS